MHKKPDFRYPTSPGIRLVYPLSGFQNIRRSGRPDILQNRDPVHPYTVNLGSLSCNYIAVNYKHVFPYLN